MRYSLIWALWQPLKSPAIPFSSSPITMVLERESDGSATQPLPFSTWEAAAWEFQKSLDIPGAR